ERLYSLVSYYSYKSWISASHSSKNSFPIFSVTSLKKREPFSLVEYIGFPTPVSSLIWDHCRSAQTQPSEKDLILCFLDAPEPHFSFGSTRSGLRCSIKLVSI